jgi:glycerol-3-phosphate dehydrogenase subunit B
LGVEVGEYVSAPSVLGLRLLNALRVKVAASDSVEMLDVVRVARVSGGHVEGRMGTNGRREVIVGADNLIIATGGLLNGLQVDGDRVFEPLTGATVSRDFEADLNQVFLSEHPLMHKGIPRELFINGFDNVRAIGAVSRGFGLYEALVSGYHAGDGL